MNHWGDSEVFRSSELDGPSKFLCFKMSKPRKVMNWFKLCVMHQSMCLNMWDWGQGYIEASPFGRGSRVGPKNPFVKRKDDPKNRGPFGTPRPAVRAFEEQHETVEQVQDQVGQTAVLGRGRLGGALISFPILLGKTERLFHLINFFGRAEETTN